MAKKLEKRSTLVKQFVRPLPVPNHEPAMAAFEHHQFNLVIAAAARAREIQEERLRRGRDEPAKTYQHQPVVAALEEFGSGLKRPEEYLIKAGSRSSDTKSGWRR